MREIKFRAWDKNNKYMDDDFFIHADNGCYNYAIRTHDTPNIEIEKVKNNMFELMQYTGFKDRDGKELYEGDIVEMNIIDEIGNSLVERGIVSMNDGLTQVQLNDGTVFPFFVMKNTNHLLLVGNIYEEKERAIQKETEGVELC